MRRLHGEELLVATHNRGKAEEIVALLRPYGVRIRTLADFGLEPPEETETTFRGNALLKARAAAMATGIAALADDSGLEVEALGGAPGVHTADWAETPRGRDFGQAMARVHDALVASGAPEPWRARFRCALALVWPDGSAELVEGEIPGRITWPMRGAQGHGYDPIFQPDGFSTTFAEMDRWEKNRLSHRGRAFDALVARCFT
jgi:XTP/dITP diphosphohydrolase